MKKIFDKNNVLHFYYENNALKLHKLVDLIINQNFKGQINYDYDGFYSIANEVFASVLSTYDTKKNVRFDTYLTSCLRKKFISELIRRNRHKRVCDNNILSFDEIIGDSGINMAEIVPDRSCETIFDFNNIYSEKMYKYLDNLSDIQKQILFLLSEDYKPAEIKKKLNLSASVFDSEMKYIKNYKNLRIFNASNALKKQNKEDFVYTDTDSMNNKMPALHLHKEEIGMKACITNTKQIHCLEVISLESCIKQINTGRIRDDHPLQRRSEQWDRKKKCDLIATAANNYPIPEIIIAEEVFPNGTYITWLLDGLQRLSTFISFMQDGFTCGKNTDNPIINYQVTKWNDDETVTVEEVEFDIRGKKFSKFPEELKDRFKEYTLSVRKFLACTQDDVDFHIRRYNNQKAMNAAQRGITFLGSRYAKVAKRLSQHSFFKNKCGFTETKYKNGDVERQILEAVMACYFINDWKKNYNDLCLFMNDNVKSHHFIKIEALADRLDGVLNVNHDLFKFNNTFLVMALFNKFTRLELDDNRFVDFLTALNNGLDEKSIDGISFKELSLKSTKDKSVITSKINLLEKLMCDFLGVSLKETENIKVEVNSDLQNCINDFTVDIISDRVNSEDDKNIVAISSFMTLDDAPDDTDIQLYADNFDLSEEKNKELVENACFLSSALQDYADKTDSTSELFALSNIPSLLKLLNYIYTLEIDDDIIIKWLDNLENNYSGEALYYDNLVEKVNNFIDYKEGKLSVKSPVF